MITISITILSTGLVIFFISLPLIYRRVPMNNFYGIRIPAAFESNERWYEINAYGGRQIATWSWLIVAAGVAGFFVPDKDLSIYTPASTAVVLLAILIPLIRIIQWSRKLPQTGAANPPTPPSVSTETAPLTQTPLANHLFTKRTLIPAIVLGLLCIGYLILINASASWLPARVATHFGGSGRPNGWMQRETYLHFIAILGLSVSLSIAGLAFVLGILQSRLKPSSHANLPTKKNQNLSWLCGNLIWLACLILAFTAGVHYLTIEANRSHPAHLPTVPFAILLISFGAANIGWIILLCFHLTKKPDAPSNSSH
jgi:uncharacterized membrane protein